MGLRSVFITPLTSVETTDKEGVGTLRWEDNKCYKYVKYTDGTANLDLVAGDVVVYVDVSSTEVTADTSDITAGEIMAGVALGAVTADASYIWIQIKGLATLSTAIGGTPADGDTLTAVAAADKACDKAATLEHRGAVGVDVSAKIVLLDCPY